MDILCTADMCPVILNSTCVFYEGNTLLYTGITTNDSLQTALQKIDAKFGDAMVGYTFTNGVNQPSAGAPVGLGGNLTANTSIGGNFTLTFAGNVQAAKHITTGGTASQFVKGDGTLDGTAYQAAGNYITALTGDVIAAGPGSVNASLAVVNSNPGTYGSGSLIPVVTVDTKGRVTALTTTAINVPSGILSFVGDVYGSGVTGSQTTLTLSNVNSNVYTNNTFLKFKVNAKGLVTGATPVTHLDVEAVLGYVPTPETRKLSINGVQHDLQSDIYWTIATGVGSVTASAPLSSTGGATPNISIPKADASTDGYLDNVDWVTFNNKVPTSRTLTINGVTYDLSANRSWSIDSMIYPGAGIAISTGTGWGTSLVDNSTNWNTAYTERISSSSSPLSILNHVISIAQATTASDGYLSATDWNTFNNKQPAGSYVTTSRTISTTGPLQGGGDLGADRTLSITQAGASADGYLSSTDWNTFNNKQAAGNYITALTGEATASGPGSATVTLSTPAVTGKLLTGVNITGGSVVATDTILEAFGKVQNQINGLVGGSIYKGVWNASTNTPTLTSGTGTRGWYYIVNVPGSTNLDGITDWNLGDWAIFDGTAWQQVDNTDAVVSVNGYTGAVSLLSSDIPEGLTNLYYTPARARTAISLTTTGTSGAATYNSTTGVLNVPIYTPDLSGYVPTTRTLTINGTAYDLSANRSWTVSGTMPAGGSAGQILSKINATDYNTQWIDNFSSQVKNIVKLGAALTKGTPVYVSSADGTNMIVSASSNTTEAGSSKTFGLLETGGALNAQVECVTYGLITGLDTSAANAAGDPVWLGPNGTLLYGLANKPVAPAHMVYIGVVTRKQSNNGEIFVNIQNGFEVDELHDVLITAPKTDGQGLFLQTVSGTQLWRNRSIADVLGYTPANGANYVPYTGATSDLVLGDNNFSAKRVSVLKSSDGFGGFTSNYLYLGTGTSTTSVGTNGISLYSKPNIRALVITYDIGGVNYSSTLDASSLTANREYTLPNATGTLALTSDIPSLAGYVPTSRTLTINGTTYDLSANRSWTIATSGGTVTSVGGTGTVSGLTLSGTVTTSGNLTLGGTLSLTSGNVTTALGFTPYNATNPSGYITSSGTAAAVSQTVAAASEANLVYAAIADNDFFRIRVGGASNAGWAEIATADDGTEPIYVRQYTGTFTSLTRTATLLDGSGNTSFPGALSAGGNISGNYILGSYFNSSAGNSENPTIGQIWTQSTGDNYLRKSTPSHFISQLGLITSSNIGSQSVSYASNSGALNGWGYGSYAYRLNGTGYYQVNDWVQFNGEYGLYCPTINGAHFFPNTRSYGSWKVLGSRNGWRGLHFGEDTGMTLMMNETEFGFHREGSGWYARFTNGTGYFNISGNSATTSQRSFDYLYASSYLESAGAVYGTIFYDNNDRAYYLDPNTSGTSLRIAGSIFSDGSFGTNGAGSGGNSTSSRVYGPKGGAYSFSGGSITGAIKIRLPFRANDSMWSMKVRIYNYSTNETSEYLLGNYAYSQGGYNSSASFIGGSSATPRTVRFGNDGSYDCVWIGETSTGWSYPVISVMDFAAGYSNGSAGNFLTNWDISIVSSFGTIGTAITPAIRFSDVTATGVSASNLYATSDVRGTDVYTTGGWFRNHTNNNGVYWSSTGWHIYPQGASDMGMRSGGPSSAMQMMTNGGTTRGYFYVNDSNQIGILTNDGNWGLRVNSNKETNLHGNLVVGYGQNSSTIYMTDGDEGTREIHCNSQRVGFLNQSSSWGSWCNDDGSWSSAGNITSTGGNLRSNNWVYTEGNAGWYNDTYGQGLRQVKGNLTYGNVVTYGENYNGWSGYNVNNSTVTNFMQNSAGTVGFYQENNAGWILFWNSGYACWGMGTDATDPSYSLHIPKYGGSNTGWIIWSDRRIKENIKTIDSALDKILSLRGVYYNKIDDPNKERCVGYIAQEVLEVVPELVVYSEELDIYNMNYAPMVAMLTEAMKEQQAQIEELKQQVQTLLNHINNGI